MIRVCFIVMAGVVLAAFSLVGCSGDKESNEYKGVGKLVAERNDARFANAERKKNKGTSNETDLQPRKKSSSSEMIFEEDVRIISTSSGKTLAKGIVYLDNGGNILNIKVIRE